jgi:dTMP kinase
MKRFYAKPPPGVDPKELEGILIVIEGQDSSGRSTHVRLLSQWLQQQGHAVVEVGLRRSELVAEELEEARQGNTLSPRTMSLFYATDFYDQLENRIVPALRAGTVVLADRYIYTLMARDLVRGADPAWVQSLYSRAIVPDACFYLQASAQTLLDRRLEDHKGLDYWESGMDLGLSRDWHDSFLAYQRRMSKAFSPLLAEFGIEAVDANRQVPTVNRDLQDRIRDLLPTKWNVTS